MNASALIHDGHGRYLLHLRDQCEGIWAPGTFALLVGGRTLDDACLEATLRRELVEEAPGLEVDSLEPYALGEATSADGLAVPIQVIQARWSGDPETVNLQEGVLLRWFTPYALERLNLSPGLRGDDLAAVVLDADTGIGPDRALHLGSASGGGTNKDLDNPHSCWSEVLPASLPACRTARLMKTRG